MAEAVVALFLLTAGVLTAVSAFHQALQRQRESLLRREALGLARGKIAELQAFRDTCTPAQWNTQVVAYQNQQSDQDAFHISIRCLPAGLPRCSPCETLEAPFGANRRVLAACLVPFEVAVSWNQGQRQVVLNTLLGPPPPAATSVQVTPLTSASIPNGAFADFSAVARDASGKPIPDVCFRWYCDPSRLPPKAGLGHVDEDFSRAGSVGRLYNFCYAPDGTRVLVDGNCRLTARCQVNGAPLSGSADVSMQP